MTYEEAIKVIKIAKAEVEWNYDLNYQIALDMAIDALEKQIPKKPRRTDAYPHRLYCAKCYWTFFYDENNKDKDMFKFCPECGQAVDLNDGNEAHI